jgi:hypothetical protein
MGQRKYGMEISRINDLGLLRIRPLLLLFPLASGAVPVTA